MHIRRGVVPVHFDDHDNTLAGGGKFTNNAYSYSNKVTNIMKA